MTFRERVFSFGSEGNLVGVMTEPEEKNESLPALVVANIGLNHRIGPNRLWVDVARRLAQRGVTTLRFDVSGLGDSEQRSAAIGDLERAALDYREALDFLTRKRGLQRFALAGLCSGVDPVHSVARDDSRVVAAAFVDGYAYPTRRHKMNRLLRFTDTGILRRGVQRRLGLAGFTEAERDEVFVRAYPPPSQMKADVDTMLARDARLLFIFTGEFDLWFSYPGQFSDMLGADYSQRVSVERYPEADHLFTHVPHRGVLGERLEEWILSARV